ncbi:MAG: dockerin type I domain-containing protein, partial [Pseudomonadales bacterium]
DRRGYLWASGSTFDLNDLLGRDSPMLVETGGAISNAGQIVANGKDARGDLVASLLTPLSAALGDLNHDCQVGAGDLIILLSHWGPCVPGRDCIADLNGDGVVGAFDLLLLLSNWGSK